MEFIGCNIVKIDSKGRVIIPANFSRGLENRKIILSKIHIMDKPVIAIFPTYKCAHENMKKYIEWPDDKYDRNLAIITQVFTMDTSHRIAISKMLEDREEKEMIAVGIGENIELWYKSDFEEYCEQEDLQLHL